MANFSATVSAISFASMALQSNQSNNTLLANNTLITQKHTDGGLHPLYVALYGFAAVLFLPGLVGNSLIIAAISKLRSLRTSTNYLIANLAVADLIMMLVMVLFLIYDAVNVSLPNSIHVCFFPSMDITVASASIMSLAAVSFDRGLAVLKPLHYERMFYRKRALHLIKAIWSYVVFIFICSMLRCKYTNKAYHQTVLVIAYIVGFVLPCVIVGIAYTIILFTTIRVIKISKRLQRSLSRAGSHGSNDRSHRRHRTKRLQLHEAKVAVNFMLILVPFLACWGFYFGTFWSEHFQDRYVNRSPLYEWFLLVIPWFISSINPIVYILFTKPLRQGCKRLIRRYLQKKDDTATSLQRIFSNRRRNGSADSQRSLLSLLWARAKRSSSTSETGSMLLSRLSFIHSRGEESAQNKSL